MSLRISGEKKSRTRRRVKFAAMDRLDDDAGLYTILTIAEIIEEAKDFKSFAFVNDHNIHYRPGQFLTIVHETGREEIRRSYSITSTPVLNESLSIGIKRIANGIFSRRLIDDTRVGDKLTVAGAGGFFCLPEDISFVTGIFFFAAGSGITPVYSLIKTLLYAHPKIKVRLVYSNHHPQSAVFLRQLEALKEKFPHSFCLHVLFSVTADLRIARLNRELFFSILAQSGFDAASTYFYTCGPLSYMRLVIFLLQEMGIEKDHIRKEDFTPYHSSFIKPLPPDKASHFATIYFRNTSHRFPVNYPDSILAAAKKQGIVLPYSCETGKCGNCAAFCTEGKIWLSQNEVLTDEDLDRGLTLTCVGHPVGGDVVLSIDG
jgi:ring-1,2-phenylacetyl-CoA epoxidase subunit PaaE